MSLIDKKSYIDVTSRLEKTQAKHLLTEFFKKNPNNISFSNHALEQLEERDLKTGDILNVLRAGKIHDDPELEHGTWRYRVETSKMTVIFAFNKPDKIRIITAWRNT